MWREDIKEFFSEKEKKEAQSNNLNYEQKIKDYLKDKKKNINDEWSDAKNNEDLEIENQNYMNSLSVRIKSKNYKRDKKNELLVKEEVKNNVLDIISINNFDETIHELYEKDSIKSVIISWFKFDDLPPLLKGMVKNEDNYSKLYELHWKKY